nr:hypothetical protein Iba_chr13dCG6420 [Ipomoea batatas]
MRIKLEDVAIRKRIGFVARGEDLGVSTVLDRWSVRDRCCCSFRVFATGSSIIVHPTFISTDSCGRPSDQMLLDETGGGNERAIPEMRKALQGSRMVVLLKGRNRQRDRQYRVSCNVVQRMYIWKGLTLPPLKRGELVDYTKSRLNALLAASQMMSFT